MKKYKLINETIILPNEKILYRIKAVRNFGNVKFGKLGGFVESENNLSHKGDCWIYDDAHVYGNAEVFGNARVYGYAIAFNNTKVYGNVKVHGNSYISGNAEIYGNVNVCDQFIDSELKFLMLYSEELRNSPSIYIK